jgi:adenylate cyclase class 2
VATEVELKARVDDPERVRSFLNEHAEFRKSYTKEDTYFCRSSEGVEGRTRFRLRREGGAAVVTYKERSREGGTEMNREYEFTVSDPQTFIYFAEAMGYIPCIDKRKEGELFSWEGTNVELSHVAGLGWFVEIEHMVEFGEEGENDEAAIAKANEKIRGILSQIGIARDRIEERYYIEMLRGKL